MSGSAEVSSPDGGGEFLDYQDLTLPLDPKVIFEAHPQHFLSIQYVKRQHELLDIAIHGWIHQARECRSDSLGDLQRGADGSRLEVKVRRSKWTHQQRLVQALFSIGPELQLCPPEVLPTTIEFLGRMVLDPIQECCLTIEKIIRTAKLYCRQVMKLYETALQKYHSTPGKSKLDNTGESSHVAQSVFETKKEKCKAIYALSATLNYAIASKEMFILEKIDIFISTLHTWRATGKSDVASFRSVFAGPEKETSRFNAQTFPPVQFPLDEFKTYFARFCHSLMLPVSYRDLESLDPIVPIPGHKAGYLFQRSRNGEWSRQYFYIQPKGMLMQFAKGKDIQIANLNQTLLRTINLDQRDFVFEICSIEVYLMESILQATTKLEFEEWKAALFYWHPPDEEIPQIDALTISSPPMKPMLPRLRHISIGRLEPPLSSPKPIMSIEFPIVIKGDLFVLDLRTKPMNSQSKVGVWKRINCCIRSNGHFAQYNIGESEKPFETIPLADTFRTHIWPLDGSLFSKKHCFSIKTPNDVNYYTVSLKRSSMDQATFNAWLYALKSYAKPEVFGASAEMEYRLYRTFWIIVNDGRRLPKDLEAYCEIMLDDQRRARTSTRMKAPRGSDTETPFWRDSFEFTDLAAFTKGITINVVQAKGSKMIPFGRTYIPVRNSEECYEGWYPILRFNDRTKSTDHLGDLRLKLQYEEQIVLPLVSYHHVLNIIVNFRENNVISRLAELVPDLEGFSKNVLRILEGKQLAVLWLTSLIDEEIAEVDSTRVNTLFRGNTLLTKALDAYMRLVGTEYLDDTLGDILRSICKSKVACEVDPSKLDKNDDIKMQRKTLMHHTQTCWRAVTESVDHFPKELLAVFSHLQRRLTEKFSERGPSGESDPNAELASLARYTGVSGFVFLRLICPAILGPKLFHIVRVHPEARAHRTLTLIAKSLQGLANLVMFGTKEDWMFPMNDFIAENIQSLKDFIDHICMADNANANTITSATSSSGIASSANSVRSLTSHQPPHSPGSISSSIFRAQSKNGVNSFQGSSSNTISTSASGSGGSEGVGSGQLTASTSGPSLSGIGVGAGTGPGAGPSMIAPVPSPTLQHAASLRQLAKDTVQPPVGSIDPAMLERNQDMPWMPHLIDLGKELAHFATTVTRALPLWSPQYEEQEDEGELVESEPSRDKSKSRQEAESVEDTEEDMEENLEEDEGDEDILRRVGQACWYVVEMTKERVELSVAMEQDERLRAAASSSLSGKGANAGQNMYAGGMYAGYGKSKVSREGSRDGEEAFMVHEHDYAHFDPEIGSFDGLMRGYDSDSESFGRKSAHEMA